MNKMRSFFMSVMFLSAIINGQAVTPARQRVQDVLVGLTLGVALKGGSYLSDRLAVSTKTPGVARGGRAVGGVLLLSAIRGFGTRVPLDRKIGTSFLAVTTYVVLEHGRALPTDFKKAKKAGAKLLGKLSNKDRAEA